MFVCQDGILYDAPTVFDNLIAKGEMPVTIGVFLNPGHDPAKGKPTGPWRVSNRSFEYDSLGDRYAQFLLEEILPEVEKQYPLSHDPELRALLTEHADVPGLPQPEFPVRSERGMLGIAALRRAPAKPHRLALQQGLLLVRLPDFRATASP